MRYERREADRETFVRKVTILSSGSLDGNVYAKIWGPTIQAERTVRTMTLRQVRRLV